MQFFLDKDRTEEITELDLGIVPAGSEKSYVIYLYNETIAKCINIKVTLKHGELEVVRAPEELNAKDMAPVELKWSPAVTTKKGLHAELSASAHELWSD